jgi:hypothetical protein
MAAARRLDGFRARLFGEAHRVGVVVRQQLAELARTLARRGFEPAGDLGVRRATVPARDAVVGDVPREDVLEDVLLLPGERRAHPGAHQLALLQAPQALLEREIDRPLIARPRCEQAQRLAPEDPADDGGRLQNALVHGGEQVDARCQDALHRVGQLYVLDPGGRTPSTLLAAKDSLVDEASQDLFEKERIAFGPFEDAGIHRRRQIVDAQQQSHQAPGFVQTQRVQRHGDRVTPAAAPVGAGRHQIGPRWVDEQDRSLGAFPQLVEQVEQRRIGPVDVFHQNDEGARYGERGEERAPGVVHPSADLPRIRPGRGRAQVGHADGVSEQRRRVLRVASADLGRILQLRHHLVDPGEGLGGTVCVLDPGVRLEHLRQRPVRDPVAVRQTPPAQHQRRR